MTVNHPSKMSSSYSPFFETKNKIINIHQADSNLQDTCDVCSHAHTHIDITCCILRFCSQPDSLAAAESRGLIGHLPCNSRFDWLSGWLPPCQLRERLCVHVRVCYSVSKSKCSPLSIYASLCFFCFFQLFGISLSYFWIFSMGFSSYKREL